VTVLRHRPLVFISSAIAGVEGLRERLHDALAALDLADDWLFEIHAPADGGPAEAQYLDIARSCDLMVLVVGDKRSPGTEDEYHEAYSDNPDKILPFYLGPNSEEVRAFRALIDSRHSRVEVASEDELVLKARTAVEHAVRNGRVTISLLREGFERRLDDLDRLLDAEPPRAYRPTLTIEGATCDHSAALAHRPHLAILGIGGAGKTYGALVELHRLCAVARRSSGSAHEPPKAQRDAVIPLYLRATAAAFQMGALIDLAFSVARFYPGPELTAQFAGEGRLAIAVDGYDDLPAAARIALLESVAEWARGHPRCRVMVLARALPDGALPDFARAAPAGLSDAQVAELFAAAGQPIRGMLDVPPELAVLVRWPFWANAIARFGLDVVSGLDLLQRTITHRLKLAAPGEVGRQDKLRRALAALALQAHPGVTLPESEALAELDAWQQTPTAASLFAPEAADQLLEAVRRSGLVNSDFEQIAFVHPLVASTLAAEFCASADGLPPKALEDAELATFTAALLRDGHETDLADVLSTNDIFFLARVVRLSPPATRTLPFEGDLARYRDTVRRLAPLAGPRSVDALRQGDVAAAIGNTWTAIRQVDGEFRILGGEYAALLVLPGSEEMTVWEGSPFAERLPERVAAAEVLWRFKREFDGLTETTIAFVTEPPATLPSDRDALARLVLARVVEVGSEERKLRVEAGLDATTALPSLAGHPHVTISTRHMARFVQEDWGHERATIDFQEESQMEVRFDDVPRFLSGSAHSRARERLRSRVEREIGSALGSGAWNRPTALAGWIW
jgi:hypothetical protein